jgi:hypothetical protein
LILQKNKAMPSSQFFPAFSRFSCHLLQQHYQSN